MTPPTQWQQRTMWAALTALSLFAIAWLAVYALLMFGKVLAYLQPLLVPVAVAAIMAYLLDPVVEWLVKRGIARTRAVLAVFAIALLGLTAILIWVLPQIYHQSVQFTTQIPALVEKAHKNGMQWAHKYEAKYADSPMIQQAIQQVQTWAQDWAQKQLPGLPDRVLSFVIGSVEGFLGVFGFVLGLVVVPIYLFFFLRDAGAISRRWSDYLPLRDSAFKNEVVSCLTEINRYLIAFFRGQILVTMIDGAILGLVLLWPIKLPFALLIGLLVAILQLVPYMGIIICWVPAVLIALATGGWQQAMEVSIAFLIVSNLDGFFIAPRIVGDAVGLHPVTVIVSVFLWTLLFGGLLGALLAVPLTATLKVLLKRYVWERTLNRRQVTVPVTEGGSVVIEVPE
ncbi:MAG TPA: AI-2E family transporter [Chthoniobacteraceae bacterium]|jgi:predicted PurR-regulated permease PerM|nr:AI-2E family transporter [Chthoniobacteraceae bacterium]